MRFYFLYNVWIFCVWDSYHLKCDKWDITIIACVLLSSTKYKNDNFIPRCKEHYSGHFSKFRRHLYYCILLSMARTVSSVVMLLAQRFRHPCSVVPVEHVVVCVSVGPMWYCVAPAKVRISQQKQRAVLITRYFPSDCYIWESCITFWLVEAIFH